MKITTHNQLQVLSETVLATFERTAQKIEIEKDLEIWVSYESLNRWLINLRWIESYNESELWESARPNYGKQGIYVSVGAESNKVIKDLVCELEMIADLPCPEVIESDNFDEIIAEGRRNNE